MTEQLQSIVAEILGASTQENAIALYLAQPKAVRREIYNLIREKDAALGKKVRAASEERRGIAFRTLDGDLVLARAETLEQILRLKEKMNSMDTRKQLLGERIAEIISQAEKFYGEDFAAELKATLANS